MAVLSFTYFNAMLDRYGTGKDGRLAHFTERHKIRLTPPPLERFSDPTVVLLECRTDGIVFEMTKGWATLTQIRVAQSAIHNRKRVWFYWPAELAIECVDEERLRSYRNLWAVAGSFEMIRPGAELLSGSIARRARAILSLARNVASFATVASTCLSEATAISANAKPVPLGVTPVDVTPLQRTAVYLRTDYWAPLQAGGSYGHTCFLAKALARTVDRLVCFSPSYYALLEEFGLEQVVLPPPATFIGELSLMSANAHYYPILKTALSVLRPAFIYERLCLGNYCAARLSQELGIPYILEFNGSETEMSRTFGGYSLQYEQVYLKIEEAAFRQATVISVVSEPLKGELIRRGIDSSKILVNPNGVDLDAYRSADDDVKADVRRQFGWDLSHRVVGFIGTFGGWHGIDVLAEVIPRVCEKRPDARFLLIGDGGNKPLIDRIVAQCNLDSRVVRPGLVPQREGARLLQACDIYVSPHNKVMSTGRFFGSPTKLFEYMALSGGIVASDLDQIGEVLTPAIRAKDLNGSGPKPITCERAILCTPGNVDEFVAGIVHLVQEPRTCRALGNNARTAAENDFSWNRHIKRLWEFISRQYPITRESLPNAELPPLSTGDEYKDEVQNQWDNNPCGSQYAKRASLHTLQWFKEVEEHRYRTYAPWMPNTMEFTRHSGKKLVEVGAGLGTDLAQFAIHGANVTDIDLSAGHLALAQENFQLRGLEGRFIHHDAEELPFEDNTFDLVYSNGVIHHTPNTTQMVNEIYRVLRPGGRVIIMVYAENSFHYWIRQVLRFGVIGGRLRQQSMGEIMSRSVELTSNDARPLVKVYTGARLRRMFHRFEQVRIIQRQLTAPELPMVLRWMPVEFLSRFIGWNLVLKARKPDPSGNTL